MHSGEVYAGADAAAAIRRQAYEQVMLAFGLASYWIPLFGSSEEREDARAYWLHFAAARRIPCRVIDCVVVVGGRCRKGRGRRYVERKSEGAIYLEWIEWRRAKRLVRKGVVALKEAA